MIDKQLVVELLFKCIDKLNDVNGTRLEKDIQTALMGLDSELDSIDFVSFIIDVEHDILMSFGKTISLTAEKAMSRKNSPFKTIDSLADYIIELL